jgi:ell wall binding domain 2 (CWB2)/WD40-like Beta Propeller Repeat
MAPSRLRRSLVASIMVAAGTTAVILTATADASLPGHETSALSASNGGTTISFVGKPALESFLDISEASWSPDGSRAAFIGDPDTGGDGIWTVKHNNPDEVWRIQEPVDGVERASVTWRGDGIYVYWAERAGTAPWHLAYAGSGADFDVTPINPPAGFHYLNPDGGPDTRVVFERRADVSGEPTGAASVWLYTPGATPAVTQVIDNASDPAISPDGTQVAFIRGGEVWVSDLDGSDAASSISAPEDVLDPTWSPVGDRIAARTATGEVWEFTADGHVSTATPLTGKPAYQPLNQNRVARLTGTNRLLTAVEVSQSHWADGANPTGPRKRAESVVLSRSDVFADALGGGALAAAKAGPLLLTPPTALDPAVQAEIVRVLGPASAGEVVYILGSTGALSRGVQDAIEDLGYGTERLEGPNRYATSIAIADEITQTPSLVLAATGNNFPDALAAGAAAGSYNVPPFEPIAVVILTQDYTLAPVTKTYLDALPSDVDIFGIGRQAATATAAYDPGEVFGDDRYATAEVVSRVFFGPTPFIGIATGLNWPDALAGGALMAGLNGPLLTTPGSAAALHPQTADRLDELSGSVTTTLIFGGPTVVTPALARQSGSLISGPLGYTSVENPQNIVLPPHLTQQAPPAARSAKSSAANPSNGMRTAKEAMRLARERVDGKVSLN